MGFEYISILPTPDEIKEQFPLAPELAACLLYTSIVHIDDAGHDDGLRLLP